jgi:GntR family carbon starvation induced transcriptional regulator
MNPIRKPTKASLVLENIRQDIIKGSFAPSEKLLMEDLKMRYGVGCSPIREALARLTSAGLVIQEEQCGFKAAPISINELYDLYRIRSHIETLALQLSIQNGDNKWEGDILAYWHQYEKFLLSSKKFPLDPERWNILQKQFSFSLVKACHSPWLLKIRAILCDQAERYRMLCLSNNYKNKKFINAFITENKILIDTILNRKEEQVLELFNQSWDQSVKMIENILHKTKIK